MTVRPRTWEKTQAALRLQAQFDQAKAEYGLWSQAALEDLLIAVRARAVLTFLEAQHRAEHRTTLLVDAA